LAGADVPQYRGMLAGPLNTAVRDLEALLPASPDAYPHNLDLAGGRVLVLRLDERGYRNASFLDDRILSPSTQGAWLPAFARGLDTTGRPT